MISIWMMGRSTRVTSSGQWGKPGGSETIVGRVKTCFSSLLPDVEDDLRPEVIRVVGVAAVPGEEFLEVVGVGGVIRQERLGHKLVAERHVVAELRVAHHQSVEHHPAVRLGLDLHVGRVDDVLVVLHSPFTSSSSGLTD